jgi:hypothetical protein
MPAPEVPNKGDPMAHGGHQLRAPHVVVPAPLGEAEPEDVRHTQAVADALTLLGEDAEPRVITDHLKHLGVNIPVEEVAVIKCTLLGRAVGPPSSGQPPAQAEHQAAPAQGDSWQPS